MPRHGRSTTVYPIALRHLEVRRVVDVNPGLRRVTFTGDQLGAFTAREGYPLPEFTSTGFDDDVWLIFPYPGETEPVLPIVKQDGGLTLPKDPRPLYRVYTVRRWDPVARELDIDFIKHGVGVATTWAYRAKPGDRLHVAGPAASLGLPGEGRWLLVIGDDTAIPAISRLMESFPSDARAQVFVEVADKAHIQNWAAGEGVVVRWIIRGAASALIDAVRASTPLDGDCYAWVAGEQSVVRDVRRHLVEDRGLPKTQIDFTGYWRRGEVVALEDDPEVPDPERNEEAWEKFHEMAELLPPLAIREAVDLGIGEHISRGVMTVADLATATKTDERALAKFLRYLHFIELLEPVDGGYALTETGEFLTVDYAIEALESDGVTSRREQAYFGLGQALKVGIADHAKTYAELREDDWFAQKVFDEAAEYANYGASPLADAAAFTGANTVVIHADSSNAIAAEIVKRNPEATVTMVGLPSYAAWLEKDLPNAVPDPAHRRRIDILEQSIFETTPPADRVVLSHVLGEYRDADAQLILRKATASLAEGGQLLVVDSTFDVSAEDEHDAEADILNLALYGSGLRTPDELDALIAGAGLRIVATEPVGWGRTLRVIQP